MLPLEVDEAPLTDPYGDADADELIDELLASGEELPVDIHVDVDEALIDIEADMVDEEDLEELSSSSSSSSGSGVAEGVFSSMIVV